MRTKHSRIKWYPVFKAEYKRDREANTSTEYVLQGVVPGIVYGDSSTLEQAMYGMHQKYIQSMKVDGCYTVSKDEKGIAHYLHEYGCTITENDAVCSVMDIPVDYIPEDMEFTKKALAIIKSYVEENHMTPDHTIKSIKAERYLMLEMEKL